MPPLGPRPRAAPRPVKRSTGNVANQVARAVSRTAGNVQHRVSSPPPQPVARPVARAARAVTHAAAPQARKVVRNPQLAAQHHRERVALQLLSQHKQALPEGPKTIKTLKTAQATETAQTAVLKSAKALSPSAYANRNARATANAAALPGRGSKRQQTFRPDNGPTGGRGPVGTIGGPKHLTDSGFSFKRAEGEARKLALWAAGQHAPEHPSGTASAITKFALANQRAQIHQGGSVIDVLHKVGDIVKHPAAYQGSYGQYKHPNETVEALTHPKKVVREVARAARKHNLQQGGLGGGTEGLARAPVDLVRATAEDPGKVIGSTLKSIPNIAAGIIPGTVESLSDPYRAVGSVKDDLVRRYTGSAHKNIERIKKEGVIPETLDVAAAATIAGHGIGAIKEATRDLHGKPRKVRPDVRMGPGVVKRQETSRNVFKAGIQHAVDKVAENARTKRMAKVEATDNKRHRAIDTQVQPGERAPLTRRGQRHAMTHDVANRKGRAVIRLKGEQRVDLAKGSRPATARRIKLAGKQGLTKWEQRAYAYRQQGLVADNPVVAIKWLEKRKADVIAEREQRAEAGHPVPLPRVQKAHNDALTAIDDLITHAHEAFTPHLGEVVRGEQARISGLTLKDPGVSRTEQIMRKGMPQRELLDLPLRPPEPKEAGSVLDLKAVEKSIARNRAKGQPKAVGQLGPHDLGFTPNSRPFKVPDRTAPGGSRTLFTPGRGLLTSDGRLITSMENNATHAQMETSAGVKHNSSDQFQINPDGTFEISHNPSGRTDEHIAQEIINRDPRLKWKYGNLKPQGARRGDQVQITPARPDHLSGSQITHPATGNYQLLMKGRDTRLHEGLPLPGYFKHELGFTPRGWDYAAGSGARAIAAEKRYTGELFRTGRESTRIEVHHQAIAHAIKRHIQWRFVLDNLNRYAIKGAVNKSVWQLKAFVDADANRLNPADVTAVNLGLIEKSRRRSTAEGDLPGEVGQLTAPDVNSALAEAIIPGQDFFDNPGAYQRTKGWSLIDSAAADEIMAATRPEHPAARAFSYITKTLPTRIILTNPIWATLQVINDVVQAGFAGVTPMAIPKTHAYLRENPQYKPLYDEYAGGGAFLSEMHGYHHATGDLGLLRAYWEGFKNLPVVQLAGRHNPLDAFFKFDHWKASEIRKSILYTKMKRDAYASMGKNVSGFTLAMRRLEGFFGANPKEQMAQLQSNMAAFERAAGYVRDFMGDFTTYPELERRVLRNNLMFYGFLRFSLRWMFYTMPFKHPIVSATLVHLALLHEHEVRDLVGAGPNDPLPPGILAAAYLGRDKQGKMTDTETVPLGRLSPTQNVLTQASGVSQLMGAFSPLEVELIQQAAKRNFFLDKSWLVNGETSHDPHQGFSLAQRLRIAAADVLGLSAFYNIPERTVTHGAPQGADSLFGDRPTIFKRPDILQSIADNAAQQNALGAREWFQNAFPLVPRSLNAKEREKILLTQQHAHKSTGPKPLGGGGSTVKPLGGGGSSVRPLGQTKGWEVKFSPADRFRLAPDLQPMSQLNPPVLRANADAKAAKPTAADPRGAVYKQRLFAHPQRPASRGHGGTRQIRLAKAPKQVKLAANPKAAPPKLLRKLAKEKARAHKQGFVLVGRGLVPTKVPVPLRAAVAKYGPLADKEAKKYGLHNGAELISKMMKVESGFVHGNAGRLTTSGAGAAGIAQFMPADRQQAIKQWGVDPWKSAADGIHALALRMSAKHGGTGLAGYNPGSSSYIPSVLAADVGGGKAVRLPAGSIAGGIPTGPSSPSTPTGSPAAPGGFPSLTSKGKVKKKKGGLTAEQKLALRLLGIKVPGSFTYDPTLQALRGNKQTDLTPVSAPTAPR